MKLLSAAKDLENEGNLIKAVEVYRQAIKCSPKFYFYYFKLGDCLQKLGYVDESIANYRLAVDLNPNSAWSYHKLGKVLSRFGYNQEAIACFRKTVELNSIYYYFWYTLGSALSVAGENNEAIVALKKAIELNPQFCKSYFKLGSILEIDRQNSASLDFYRKSIDVYPHCYKSHIRIANILRRQDKNQAIIHYQKAVKTQAIIQNKPIYVNLDENNFSDFQEPYFLIVAVGKSGTTSLFAYLMQHPLILPPAQKELHGLDKKLNSLTLLFYKKLFPAIPRETNFITGEATPYLFSHLACQQAYSFFPKVKLIFLLRNPIDRLVSRYYHDLRGG